MKPKARFIKSVIETALKNETQMPWVRGARRAGFANQRHAETPLLRLKTA